MAQLTTKTKARQWLATIHVRKSIDTAQPNSVTQALLCPEWIGEENAQNALYSREFSIKNNNFAQHYTPENFLSVENYPKNLVFACGQWERCPNMLQLIQNNADIHQDQGLHLQMFFRFKDQLTINQTKQALKAVPWMNLQKVTIDNGASEYPLKEETREPGMDQYSFQIGANINVNPTNSTSAQMTIFNAIHNCKTYYDVLKIDGVAHRMTYADKVWSEVSSKRFKEAVTNSDRLQFPELLDKQKQIIEIREQLPSRKIVILCDPIGGWGKSQLSFWLQCHKKAYITDGADKEKTMKGFMDFQGAEEPSRWVIFDIPRAKEYWSYTCMESFSNGHIQHGRYQGGHMIVPNGCLIIVMCNSIPDDIESKLSKDRLHIIHLSTLSSTAPGVALLNNVAFSDD